MSRLVRAGALAAAALVVLPAVALAHPLGNFTINHFAGIRVVGSAIALDVVIDRAEIPTFQERQQIDANGDGTVSPDEQEAARQGACPALAQSLSLAVDGSRLSLAVAAAGISFPPGAGGLPTMRLVCDYTADLPAPMASLHELSFADSSFAERIGWREIVVGDDTTGVSTRLTAYPQSLLSQPLDIRSLDVPLSAAVATAAWSAPDAEPLAAPAPAGNAAIASVPGGVGSELSGIIDTQDLNPAVVLVSLGIAVVLGAAHAVSPGHGKTIMAAYLVGTRGTARHAVALGLTVTVAHTLGVLVLAAVTLLAASSLPPERLYPILGVGSGALVIAIGGALLIGRLRVLLADRRHARAHAGGAEHHHDHDDDHAHGRSHDHGHSHAPAAGARLSWRGLFALGLSGGLLPSASALILLLGSISAGRIGYGILLVIGFGVGMALVLGGVGLVLVRAARLVERLPKRGWPQGALAYVQAITAIGVIVLGVFLTGQALTQVL